MMPGVLLVVSTFDLKSLICRYFVLISNPEFLTVACRNGWPFLVNCTNGKSIPLHSVHDMDTESLHFDVDATLQVLQSEQIEK